MAISTNQNILNILKIWYRDKVENLLFRNSPVLKKIEKTRVEGKVQSFAALYGRGGAVAANFLTARAKAGNTSRNAEFQVTPGDLFSVYNMNAKEVAASLSKKGAFMKVAGNKLFAATEAFRKTLAASLYGTGFGEIGLVDTAYAFVANTAIDITLTDDAIIKIDIDSDLDVKASAAATTIETTLTVNSINGNTVNVTPDKSYTATVGDYICLAGSIDGAGKGKLPVGLDAWLPIVANRTGVNWTSYITQTFFNVNRSAAPERLAGAYVGGGSGANKLNTIQDLLRKVRRNGSAADLIVMNDEDWLEVSKLLETTNTYFTQTSDAGKKKAVKGFSEMKFAFSTSWVDNVYDDPYCPKNKFYILDSDAVELWCYTKSEAVSDGVADNNPGKQDVEALEGQANEGKPYGLLIDDFITVQSGTADADGPTVEVTLQLYGSFVVTNPSVCGVGVFDTTIDTLGM